MTINDYVPLDIKIQEASRNPPLYWRVGNGTTSLLELSLLPESGLLSSITLVMIDGESVFKTNESFKIFSSQISATPVINPDIWEKSNEHDFNKNFIDNFELEIRVYTSPNSILITIGEPSEKADWINIDENLALGLNDQKCISKILIKNLATDKVEKFYLSIK
ncbi:hypothetical protein [Carnimonas bestiolae]|uniref:hypothetical protein n=1 Tax=Carnimonas bestiolae TaxID=3402172 RepID=UPI003F4AC305